MKEAYWDKCFAHKTLIHQKQVADLYYDNVPAADNDDFLNEWDQEYSPEYRSMYCHKHEK